MPITNEHIKLDELLDELYHLREENQQLKVDNDFLQRQNNGLKLELQRVKSMEMFEFANEFCNDKQLEQAGKDFARALLGGA